MSERDQINTYLTKLNRYLARLPKADAEEVIREIESHIYDAIDAQELQGKELVITELLQGFGAPRELAEQYISHMLEGTPPPAGFSAISQVKHKATKALYWGSMIVGYSLGVTLIALAILKIFMPDSVGMWSTQSGQSVVVGLVEGASQGQELLGLWLTPIFLIAGGLITKFTYTLLGVLKRALG